MWCQRRPAVRAAVGCRCALCGLDAALEPRIGVVLEAARIHRHSHDCPCAVENGLCLFPLQHRAPNAGMLRVRADARVQVSPLGKERALRDHLQGLIDAAKSTGTTVDDDLRSAIRCVLKSDGLTPEHCLAVLVTAYPKNVHVLSTAVKSARDSRNFKYGQDLLELLLTLVTSYRDALVARKGDVVAHKVFGKNDYAAVESDTVEKNAEAKKARTFSYGGRELLMLKHLKIGGKDSIEETIRVHFEWDAQKELVVIGHCGEHLRFS